MLDKIATLYGERMLAKSAIRLPGGADVFQSLMQGKGYRTVLEIGTYRGCSAALMSRYCDQVITIDLRHGQLERTGQSFDRRKFWASLGADNIDSRLVDGDDEKTEVIATLDFDFAFVDGAHDAESVRLDFDLVKRCGRVLFHDYADTGRPDKDHVFHFVNSLPRGRVEVFGVFALWTDIA
jgi:predicted O-methyltransferase YrrM